MSDNINGNSNGNGELNPIMALGALAACLITGIVGYFWGKNDRNTEAYEEGFERASDIYEKKYEKTVEEFLSGKKIYEENEEEYLRIITELMEELERLKNGEFYKDMYADII